MIHVLATIELHPGQRDAFLREFHALMPLVHAEPGCLEYGPAVNCPTNIPVQNHLGEDTVTIIEKWADDRVKVKPFVKGVTLRVLQPV